MIDKVLNISQGTATASPSSPVSVNMKQEDEEMSYANLAAYLKENPAAQAEFDNQIKAHGDERHAAGLKEGREKIEGRVKKAFSVVGQSDAYPEKFTALAMKVATGEEEQAALTAVITMHDQDTEQKNSQEAKTETEKTPETPPNSSGGPLSPEGKIETPEQLGAHLAGIKQLKGLPVK